MLRTSDFVYTVLTITDLSVLRICIWHHLPANKHVHVSLGSVQS